jgi:hypothetical protein
MIQDPPVLFVQKGYDRVGRLVRLQVPVVKVAVEGAVTEKLLQCSQTYIHHMSCCTVLLETMYTLFSSVSLVKNGLKMLFTYLAALNTSL